MAFSTIYLTTASFFSSLEYAKDLIPRATML